MEDATRREMIKHLDELRALLATPTSSDAGHDAALTAHVDELRVLVLGEAGPHDEAAVPSDTVTGTARGLEQRLLALGAEHPQFAAFAARFAQALETAGL